MKVVSTNKILSKDIEKLIISNSKFFESKIKKGLNGLGKISSSVYTLNESLEKHNAGISKDEIIAWVWYRKKQGIPMKNWDSFYNEPTIKDTKEFVKKGILFVDATSKNKSDLVPYAVFCFGNIYEKINALKKRESEIVEDYGKSVFDNHISILENIKPKALSITNPVESERPVVLAISETANNFLVSSLKEVPIAEALSLKEAFKEWLRGQADDMFKKVRPLEIINYYLSNLPKPRNYDADEWSRIKKFSRDEGERLFKIFLHTALEYQDQVRLDADFNMKYNAIAPLQHHKIPVALQVSKNFNGLPLSIREAQREGIAFMELVGSGIIAYDVGVGKTITAIIELANAINSGKCKRPLVAVPNPTYKNWIKELIGNEFVDGILSGTGIKLNEWYNLGSDYNNLDFDTKVNEKTITLVTYEGLEKIGFSQSTSEKHFKELSEILSQTSDDLSDRDREKNNEKFREIIGIGNKETIADIETLGFDYVVVDEAHNFKNVFSEVKADKNQGKQFHIQGGQPSNRAIKLFFISNYIQRTYGRNVMLLTATPFTNSPLEIYSMLSFVSYDYMKSWGIYNIRVFFETYIQETTEPVVTMDGEIQQRNVVKSFNNRISLQKLINSHINFKTGEEANIPRPVKVNIPKTTVVTENGVVKLPKDEQVLSYLKMTPKQVANQLRINEEASKGADKDDPGKLLRLMSMSLNNALSPFLFSGKTENYFDFVEESPKIKYAIECIRSVKEWHESRKEPVSGQVMYIDRGKDYFHYIKEYLEQELGYKKDIKLISNPKQKVDEVEIITSGISQANKEKIKVAFNEGTCKIIIGTSTIKEGINLQEKSTCLYNLYPNWNPTDVRQLEGRIWRQKNENGYVRIVMPLMENSMDIFVFQKLEEKTSRINDLWNKADRGNVLDEESLDPNEVKFALVTDIGVLARFEKKQIEAELSSKLQLLQNSLRDVSNYSYLNQQLETLRGRFFQQAINYRDAFKNVRLSDYNEPEFYYSDISTVKIDSLSKKLQNEIDRHTKVYDTLNAVIQVYDDKMLIQAISSYDRVVKENSYNWELNKFKEIVSQYTKIKRTIFEQRGFAENTDLSIVKEQLDKEVILLQAEFEEIKTPEFEMKLYDRIADEKKKYELKGGLLKDRVSEFASLNYLMSYKFNEIDHTKTELPKTENKSKVVPIDVSKEKRIKLAKAKAKALKLKLKLVA